MIIYSEGAIFISYFCTHHTNPPFQKFSAVIQGEIDNVNKFDYIDYNCSV